MGPHAISATVCLIEARSAHDATPRFVREWRAHFTAPLWEEPLAEPTPIETSDDGREEDRSGRRPCCRQKLRRRRPTEPPIDRLLRVSFFL